MTQEQHDGAAIRVSEDEPEPAIGHHVEDWLGFVIFWAMAAIVFLQFFTRYVMNDSFAWTEEIARYLLMVVTFVGAATAFRRGTHISVEMASVLLPEPAVRVLGFLIDVIVVGFVALLCWYAVAIAQRMQIQTMTVIPLSMSFVYGAIGIGCVLMLWRAAQRMIQNLRRGWRPAPSQHTLPID